MSFDENNFDDAGGDAPLPEESNNNRTFMIAVGILGGIILISIACLVGVYLFSQRGGSTANLVNGTATVDAANTFVAQALTLTATAAIQPTNTSLPSSTPVVGIPTSTNTPDPALPTATVVDGTPAAATATVGAALTQAAAAQTSAAKTAAALPLTTIIPTVTALGGTGFADEVGLPGLVVMALVFVIVILLARRLRIAPAMNR